VSDAYCNNCDDTIDSCKCGDTEVYSSVFAVCPYCGHDNDPDDSDGFLYSESTDSRFCGGCGRRYRVSVNVSYSWTTSKMEAPK